MNLYEPVWLPFGLVKNTILDSGSITIIVCNEGGKRLIKPVAPSLINVTQDEKGIILTIESKEPKNFVVRLMNLLGKVLFDEQVYADGSSQKFILIPNIEYSSSLLLLQIFNHTEIHLFKLIYLK